MKKLFNKEILLYITFGIITTILNILLFYILCKFGLKYFIANLITLIVVKIVAYICNKNFVFKSKCRNIIELIKEFIRFIIFRGLTLLIDYFGLIFLVEVLSFNKMPSKVFITILVVIINYITGKKHVFKTCK